MSTAETGQWWVNDESILTRQGGGDEARMNVWLQRLISMVDCFQHRVGPPKLRSSDNWASGECAIVLLGWKQQESDLSNEHFGSLFTSSNRVLQMFSLVGITSMPIVEGLKRWFHRFHVMVLLCTSKWFRWRWCRGVPSCMQNIHCTEVDRQFMISGVVTEDNIW